MEMGKIGGTVLGGCNRQALTDLDKEGRDLFINWCKDAGCNVRIDTMGNIFARRNGNDNSLPPICMGSHLDTQPTGGKFDGVYGVLAGLEVINSLNDHSITTKHPVEVIVWTNEEGARFSPAMQGSGVYVGAFKQETIYQVQDKSGKAFGDELKRIGYLGETPCSPTAIKAFFELHIEQGPILEKNQQSLGIVKGVQGMYWYDLHITGQPVHAGPTPMNMRLDSMKATAEIIIQIYEIVEKAGEDARVTFGDINASPGVRNTVPKTITLAIDIRHPNQTVLDKMEEDMLAVIDSVCERNKVSHKLDIEWRVAPVIFAKECVSAIEKSISKLGYRSRNMVSGAGHDSVYISQVAPTAMIFIPCEKGISHNEKENIKEEDAFLGSNVLLHSVLQIDIA